MTTAGIPSFEAIFRASPIGMLISSEDGVFLDVNEVALASLGFRRDELVGKTSSETRIMPPEARVATIDRLRHEGRLENVDLRLRTKSGELLDAKVSIYPADHAGTRVWITAFLDLTPRQVGDVRFRELLDAAADAMLVVDRRGTIVDANRRALETFGYATGELVGSAIEELVPARYGNHRGMREAFVAAPSARTMGSGLELFARRKDGTELACEIGLSPLTIAGEPFVVAAVRDVGEMKRTANVLRAVLEHLPNLGIWLVDRDLRIVRADGPALQLVRGWAGLDNVVGQRVDASVSEANRGAVVKMYETVLAGGSIHLELQREGRFFDVDTVPIREGGVITHALAVFHEVTARKAELAHTQALLREIHHRVKNNLQVVSSLLRMQARSAPAEARAAFDDAQARIRAMALLHERLYGSHDFARIDMQPYLAGLCSMLQTAHGAAAEITVEVRSILLPIDHAVPCALLVNELVTNCLKHAFPAHCISAPRITVSMQRAGTQLVLEVADNGVGIPDAANRVFTTSLGMTLMHDLARQLQGTVQMVSDNGVRVCVTFPEELP